MVHQCDFIFLVSALRLTFQWVQPPALHLRPRVPRVPAPVPRRRRAAGHLQQPAAGVQRLAQLLQLH